ncbi:MAG: nucleoside hydrolase [Mycobacteriales bacterium]
MTRLPALDPALLERLLTPPSGRVDVVIDTDATNEVDDQLAIVWALLRPDIIEVKALHACPYSLEPEVLLGPGFRDESAAIRLAERTGQALRFDPVPAQEGMRRAAAECRRLAALVGVDVPVVEGATRVMSDPDSPVESDATASLIELAHQDREGPLWVLGIGAATNLASAVLLDPTIREHVNIVWTSAYPTFWPLPNASFNLAQDLCASRFLFDSGVPLTYLPGYYIGEQLGVSVPELEQHVRGKGVVGDALFELCMASRHLSDVPGASKVMWDLIDVAWVLDPSWLPSRLLPAPALAEDLRWVDAGPGRHLMREAVRIDRDALWTDFFRVLAEHAVVG